MSTAARERFIDVGDAKLWVRGFGSGTPTIVLEAGLGGYSRLWDLVLPLISDLGTVVTYDRAGLGRSDATDRPRSAEQQAQELAVLLERVDAPWPYVLVGHSMGAFIVQAFAINNPERIGAVVLVDPSHEDPRRHGLPPARTALLVAAVLADQFRGVAGSVIRGRRPPTLVERMRDELDLRCIDPEIVREVVDMSSTEQATDTIRREGKARLANFAHIKELRERPFPAVPLIVLAAGRVFPDLVRPARRVGIAEDELRAMFHARCADLAELSPHGRVVVVPDAGHMINVEAPAAVADAVAQAIIGMRRLQLTALRDAVATVVEQRHA